MQRKEILVFLATAFLQFNGAMGQSGISCDVLRFQSAKSPFIEVHLDFESRFFQPIQGDGSWKTNALIEAVVSSSSGIVNYGKTYVSGPPSTDSLSALIGHQFHLERITVPAGSYNVSVKISDAHPGANFSQEINLPVMVQDPEAPSWSDPFIVEAFAPADQTEQSTLTRSGYEMLPVVSAQLSTQAPKLQFYAELYQTDQVVDSMLLVSCWLEEPNGQVVPASRRFFRKTAAPILPVFTSIPLTANSAGKPLELVVQAVTKANELIAENRLPLQFIDPMATYDAVAANGDIPAYFRAFTDSLALEQHIRDHHPRADASQRKTIDGFIDYASVSQMQAFLTHFWEENAPENPEAGWRSYATAIAYADSAYGACRQGHGAETDMGYIYLRYGPPNTIVKRHNETDYYPYEIWHYHRAGAFTNKRFLFFSPHMVAECFTLLHSDMLGEVQNSDWLHQLRNRENRLRVTDSQLNRLNPRRDTFSGEEPEDLFFNPR